MEAVEELLEDWHACRPDGVVLRATNLSEVISRIVARADRLSDPAARSQAYKFLAPAESGPPLLVQRLRIDGGHRFGGPDAGPESIAAVVHFLCFWQTLDEVWRASRPSLAAGQEREAIVDEVSSFRDGLLSSSHKQALTVGSLIEALVAARKTSVDQSAWAPLQAVVARTAAAASSSGSSSGPAEALDPHDAYVVGRSRGIQNEHLPLDAVAMLILPWLQELVEDYRRGEKAQRIQLVSEALGCRAWEACSHLCAARWNVETTLRRKRAVAAAEAAHSQAASAVVEAAATRSNEALGGTGGAEVSSSAKPLATEELPKAAGAPLAASTLAVGAALEDAEEQEEDDDCPICAQPFGKGARGMEQLSTKCCQQVLCAHCAATLTTPDGGLRCPFCRRTDIHPARRDDGPEPGFSGVFQAFGNFGRDANRFVKELFGAEPERTRPRPNLRLDVVFR